MKSIPCIPLSQAHDSSADSDIDSYRDGPRPAALGPRGPRGPKIQTMIEVLRCGLARPARSTTTPLDGASLQPSKGWTPIYHAVYHNREAALLHFLRVGHSPDDVAKTGQPPLCIAVAMGYMSMVKILCEAGADVQAKTSPDEETALHLAIKTGRTDIMEILLAYRPNLEAQTLPTGETPLHYAAGRSNSLSAVVALLKRGANYEARDSQGRTPAELALNIPNLHAAVAIITKAHGKRNRLSKEKEMLLKHVEKPQSRYSMNNELIADIFKAGCDPDSSVLVEAIKRGEVNLVDMFLERGADPNRKTVSGVRPIFAAIDCPSAQQIVGLLNKHKADVMGRNADGLTVLQAVLQRASKLGKDATAAMFESLLSNGADPKVTYIDGKTLLHHAASSTLNLEKVAAQLLEHGVKVDARDNQGNTALHLATGRSCIELLLKNGAGVNLVNNKRLTPLLRAITMVSKELEGNLEGLVKASETRKADSEGKTALHLAAENGLDKTVKWLLRSRAETTMVDSKGRTPLLLAVLNQQWSTVPLLAIQPGINTWDEAGMTALHHIAMSTPKEPATWKDIASAASAFCERGVSRSMRDRSGATPLIQAIKNLPEEGLAVVDVLLAQSGQRRGNCVGHQDHKRQDALHYAATLGKPEFVHALLKAGAPFELQDWIPGKGRLELTSSTDKHTLKLLAERDWLRRMMALHQQFTEQKRPSDPKRADSKRSTDTEEVEEAPLEPILPKVLPLDDLAELLRMGLLPSALPRSKPTNSLLWVVLNQTAIQPTLPADYLHDSIKLLLANNQDPNALTTRQLQAPRPLRGKTPSPTPTPEPLTMHPITYLLEKNPTVDMDTLTLLLDAGANLTTPSPFFNNRFPLHSAVAANRPDAVDELLTRTADPNAFENRNRTPLFLAAEKGFWEIAEDLVRKGADVNAKDVNGNSVLHSAVAGGSSRIVAMLLRKGARAGAENDKKAKPAKWIPEGLAEKEKEKVAGLLRAAEEQEGRDAERVKRQVEEEERRKQQQQQQQQQQQKEAQEKERLKKEREERERQRRVSAPPVQSLPARTPQINPPAANPTPNNAVHVSKQVVSIQYKPTATSRHSVSGKPTGQPRVDSGFATHPLPEAEDAAPELDRSKATLDGKGGVVKKKSEDELASWLTVSGMLDRL